MATDWRSAYFTQAEADYTLFRKLAKQEEVPLCQKLHFLQMATEKMAKGFLTPPGRGQYKNTHNAFVDFTRTAVANKSLRDLCGYHQKSNFDFSKYLKRVCAKAKLVESLAPIGGSAQPNPEYPWEDNGKIITPVEHDFPTLKLTDNKMQDMIMFLDRCFELIADELKNQG